MTEPVATAHLTYTLATTPPALIHATAHHPRQGRLDITVTRATTAQAPATCRGITIEVPTGTHPKALTTRPERIDTAYSAPGSRTWRISKTMTRPDRTVFTCTPENPRYEAAFDDTSAFTLILDNIPLDALDGTTTVRITDDTTAGSAAYARHTAELPVTVKAAGDDT
ncbi:hypothetical protein [Streptomyces sp. NPDC001657]|uniref:hypothetical protein n=1 Tax=unclassified Streptomyces TaxID=2593676 RepID=UPI003321CBB1